MLENNFDVIVVGGGHAGIEASYVCSKLQKNTLMITNKIEEIGKISCNPSIGGVGKGQLVREIEIFGGLMSKITDLSCTFSKTLNISKGYSLRSTRIQVDKYNYIFHANNLLRKQKKLTIIQGTVTNLLINNKKIIGVCLNYNTKLFSNCVILTTGTFMNNKIYIGNFVSKNHDNELFDNLKKIIPNYKKFKTGTPPRIDQRTINYDDLKEQKNDYNEFSFFNKKRKKKFFKCWVTKTTNETRDIVTKNIKFSSMYNGIIKSKGPRYCPSIEDKYIRFPHNRYHNIFLEKESIYTNEIYPNGISTSFSYFFQLKIVNSIKGLEKAKIIRPGYAIEYNYFDPKNLKKNLESKFVENLFLAGQINGTTGYEEAASQGFYAGINCVKKIEKKKPFYLKKENSYIGVLIDDITRKKIEEPYRMFTSRTADRMFIREDNVIERLLEKSYKNNLLKKKEYEKLKKKLNYLNSIIRKTKKKKKIYKNNRISIFNLIKKYNFKISYFKKKLNFKIKKKIFYNYINAKIKYKCYYNRFKKEKKVINKKINFKIPKDFNFNDIKGLSNEFLEKIQNRKISNIKDIYKINCITPTNVFIIKNFFIKKFNL